MLDDKENTLKYVIEAVLTNEPPSLKINLFYLIYQLLKDDEPDLALKHAKLFAALKLEYGAPIPSDIEELIIDEDELDVDELEMEIKDYWFEYKFKDQELQYGTITRIFENGKAGFITSDDGESSFFISYEFKPTFFMLKLIDLSFSITSILSNFCLIIIFTSINGFLTPHTDLFKI